MKDLGQIEGYENMPDWYAKILEHKESSKNVNLEIDINKVEAAEYENHLVSIGYYQRMRCLNG